VALCGQAALLFFENSTRTRLSFEAACYRLGLGPILIDAQSGSSLNKGETQEDTVLNVAALDPKVIIVRCGDQLNLEQMSQEVKMPIINAGWGAKGHPTQALLDLYTIWKEKNLSGTKFLIVGDILHSRVASSHFEIFNKLGVEIAGCGPEGFRPMTTHPHLQWFDSLQAGLEWSDVVMTLRVQSERHSTSFDMRDYHASYGINKERLRHLKADALLMHPGPVNWGVELASEVAKDPRARILQQVNNGVFVRTALLKLILG
jgi:aspartate carbamoyltransferase catalytic subunit